jgi:hypothetical protein
LARWGEVGGQWGELQAPAFPSRAQKRFLTPFPHPWEPSLNNAGQVAFEAFLTGTSGGSNDGIGIFLFDDVLGLLQAARVGDSLLGSTVTELRFGRSEIIDAVGERRGLNELGQIAYRFVLADGRQGIAIWTIPEPVSLALVAIGGSLLLVQRRRDGDIHRLHLTGDA